MMSLASVIPTPRKRFTARAALLIYPSIVALAGAATMYALVRAVMLEEPPAATSASPAASRPAPTLAQRLAFARPEVLSRARPRIPATDLKPTVLPDPSAPAEPGGAVSWSTETRAEQTPAMTRQQPAASEQQPRDRFALLPSLRLPWARPGNRRPYTVNEKLAEIGPTANVRLASRFEAAKVAWPPAEVTLVAIKDERTVELHARPSGGAWKLVHRYKVLAASGAAGPKLRQGDKQVPEGVYGIASLNPNSAYHVSLRVNYPNAFDRQMAAKDGRRDLGGDIMIHGKNLSAGCLAMGDEGAEELFVLAAQVGLPNVRLVIAPTDLRQAKAPPLPPGSPAWTPKLYADLATTMSEYKAPKPKSLLSYFSE